LDHEWAKAIFLIVGSVEAAFLEIVYHKAAPNSSKISFHSWGEKKPSTHPMKIMERGDRAGR